MTSAPLHTPSLSSPLSAHLRRHLIISDLHLCSSRVYARDYAWFKPATHLARLLTLLRRECASRQGQLEQLTLLGDTWDTWLAPPHEVPPSYEEIFAANPQILDALAQLIERGVRVALVPGNHDFDLDAAALERALPGACLTPRVLVGSRVLAQHGHELTFFNACDLDPVEGRPIGYFVSRLAVEHLPYGHSHSPGAIAHYIRRGTLRAIHRPHAVEHLLRTLFYDICKLREDDEFVLDARRRISAAEVVARYARAVERLSVRERLWRMSQRPLNLTGSARRLAAESGRDIILLGHCHHRVLRRLSEGAWYLNPGAWCEPEPGAVELALDASQTLRAMTLWRADAQGRLVQPRHVALSP